MIYRNLVTESQQGDTKFGATELISVYFNDRDTNNHSLRDRDCRVVLGTNRADCSHGS